MRTKYHVVVNGCGLPMACAVMPANVSKTLVPERLSRTAFVVIARVRIAFADQAADAQSNCELCRKSRAEPRIGQRGQSHGSALDTRRLPVGVPMPGC